MHNLVNLCLLQGTTIKSINSDVCHKCFHPLYHFQFTILPQVLYNELLTTGPAGPELYYVYIP